MTNYDDVYNAADKRNAEDKHKERKDDYVKIRKAESLFSIAGRNYKATVVIATDSKGNEYAYVSSDVDPDNLVIKNHPKAEARTLHVSPQPSQSNVYDNTIPQPAEEINDENFNNSITSQQDKEYLDAVRKGDTDTAQRIPVFSVICFFL